MRVRRTPLWRALPMAGGLAAALMILLGLGILLVNERLYQTQKQREAQVQASILAAGATAAVDFGDEAAARDAVDALGSNPDVLFASVYDKQGKLIVTFKRGTAGAGSGSGAVVGTAQIERDGERIGSAAIGMARETFMRKLMRYALIGLFILLAATVAAILSSAHGVLRRTNRELQARADALVESNRQLNVEMEERAKAEEQLRQSHKMQALGQLTGGIAHDFNNLLTVIQGSADILQRPGLSEEKRSRYAAAISETAARAAALTSQLLAFARRQPLRPQLLDVGKHIEGMAELLDRSLGERVTVVLEKGPQECLVEVDPGQFENAILNVAVNARDAMPGGGTLTIHTGAAGEDLDSGAGIDVTISDTGSGIDADTLGRVFEPFFTTKGIGKGTGLGLSQVYGFAAQSGGRVTIESEPGKGTKVRLTLPCAKAQHPAQASAPAPAAIRPARAGRILVVDDNASVGALAEAMIAELGHQVLRASNGGEALAILDETEVDAVFTDVVMPGMSGIELAQALATRRPSLPVVLTTGFSDEVSSASAMHLPVLFKPYTLEAIETALARALQPRADELEGASSGPS